MPEKAIDPKLLEGLHFHFGEEERQAADGETAERRRFVTSKRPLSPDKVIDWAEVKPGVHVIVTACGKKWKRTEFDDRVEFVRVGVDPHFYSKDKDGKYMSNSPIVLPKEGKAGGKTAKA